MKICFASNNQYKLAEVKHVLRGDQIDIASLDDIHCLEELPETGQTLEENALQKAQYVFQKYAIACFADDTGLEVEALQGAPGVYSARYAGEHKNSEDNMNLLLAHLKDNPNRNAQFRTVIALVGLKDQPLIFEGIIRGSIISDRRGSSGFGYDPVFIPHGHTRTFAEMSLEEKNTVSHRAIAVKKLEAYLQSYTIPR
ncbi:MAG: non-canonical purine NTP diphosphatase [Cyclobacteriaceae bacterium]|nr:non-canonical purine NTP diphosphatase [Cyclobacteriaceae bacterium]MDH4294933.1 non-canonical purine NTP diphosphatase [Cyclobacteriaceae bacterium]MDH5249350.1 non-canonical purine NTP diphosphatase [Cyclobacteriaceae bacterium]